MNKDLKLTGAQYNLALTVFFFPYAVFEVPSKHRSQAHAAVMVDLHLDGLLVSFIHPQLHRQEY